MTTMLQLRGTCPACFGEFQLHDDVGKTIVGKHGWQEIGGRQVGVYDVVTHDGECFGFGWAPFELSPEGTWAFLNQSLWPRALRTMHALWILTSGNPNLHVTRKLPGTNQDTMVLLTRTNEEGSKRVSVWVNDRFETVTAYEKERASRIRKDEDMLRNLQRWGCDLVNRANAWKLTDLKDGSPKGPTIHFKNEGARLPYCGTRSLGLHTTAAEDATTCTRCLKGLETEKKEQAAREALQRDADALTAYLKANGSQTKAALKKGLGWDTKRVNRAVDQAERPWREGKRQPGTIRSVYNYPKPESFEAIP